MSWPTAPLKRVSTLNDDKLDEATHPDRSIRYIDIGAVGRGRLVEEPAEVRFGESPSRARRLVSDGDTIISTVRTYLRAVWPVSTSSEDLDDLVVSTGFAVVRPQDVDPRYLSWALQSDGFIEEVVARSVGVSYPAINPEDLAAIGVPKPPLEEQRRIAAFLDAETERIDQLIATKTRMIEVLGEESMAYTRETLGGSGYLDPLDVTREEAQVNNVDPIRLSWRFRFGSGTTPKSGNERYYGKGVPWLTTGDLNDGRLSDCPRQVTQEALHDHSVLRLHPAGSLVIAMYGATIGRMSILDFDSTVNQACCVLSPEGDDSVEFVFLWLLAYRTRLVDRGRGAGQPNISQDLISSLRVPLPAPAEQRRRVKNVQIHRDRATHTQATLERQIDLLRERRRSLITAAVTGEMEVP